MPDARALLRNQGFLAGAAFVVAALLSALIAWGAAVVIEGRSRAAVTTVMLNEGYTWASVEADGLQVILTGTAPNEAARFRAVNLTGGVVDTTRIRDQFEVTPAKAVEAPRFSAEILRNDDGIQLIGLLPQGDGPDRLRETANAVAGEIPVSDMLETAAYEAPEGWDDAFAFALEALEMLPRSKISVAADAVAITAIAASEAEKTRLEAELQAARPEGLLLRTDISAPRPVLTPFTLRFVKDAQGARFDACSADTERARARIIAAASAAGAEAEATCTIGLGVPSPSWAQAAETAIKAVAELGDGAVTFSDADVTLLVGASVAQGDFDRVVGELRSALPDVFSLNASLEKKADAPQGPAEFTAVLSVEEGRVELRGRLTDDRVQAAVESYAKSRFGAAKVYVATRLDEELPDGWPLRVLAGLEALAELDGGRLLVRADTVEVSGVAGSTSAKARIAQILGQKLGQGATFKVDVKYDEALDPLAALPTAQECSDRAQAVLSRNKIVFPPGAADIDAAAMKIMDALATALKDCGPIRIEIGGHTDAQGSEGGNQSLSQARAEAVLLALQGRQVDVTAMTAVGYGEARPIADNGTEEGREANRRIEFTLIVDAAAEARAAATSPAEERAAAAATDPDAPGQGQTTPFDDTPSVAPESPTERPKPRPAADN